MIRSARRRRLRCCTAFLPAGIMLFALLLGSFLPDRAAALGPEWKRRPLSNGATLLVSEQRNLPMVTIRMRLSAGASFDPPGLEGLANLTADLLTEGTKRRSAAQISDAVDFIGASLDADAATDFAEISLRVLKKDLAAGVDLLADVLLNPVFAEEELTRRREAVLATIRAAEDNPTSVAIKAFRRAVFAGEPYGHPVVGIEESVSRIRRSDVVAFYRRTYLPAQTLVVAVGDIDADEAHAVLGGALAGWRAGTSVPAAYPAASVSNAQSVRIRKPVTQAAIVLGHRGIARKNPDYEALGVMNYILGGGGFSSRLMDSIRTQAGLAYSVGSSFDADKESGSFQLIMQTKNTSVPDAIRRARAEIERIRSEMVSDEELDEAKRYLTGSFPLHMDTHAEIADFVAGVAYYDLGLDYAQKYVERVNAVTKDDVLRVAREHLHPDRFVEVIVADLDQLGSGDESVPNGGSPAPLD